MSEFFDLHRSRVRLAQSLHLRGGLLRFHQSAKFVLVNFFVRQELHPFFQLATRLRQKRFRILFSLAIGSGSPMI